MATVLTYVGEEWAASRLANDGALDIAATHIGWGTVSTGATKSDTSLTGEVGNRGSAAVTKEGTGSSAKFQAVATLTNGSAGTYAITEAGLFSATTSGSMFVRGDFGVITLNPNDQITFTITIDPQ